MFFIVNSRACQGQAHKIFMKKILPALTKMRISFGFQITTTKEEAVAITQELTTRQEDCIVVAGGDGSVNALVPTIVNTKTTLGILPLGGANDFATAALGISQNPKKALRQILSGQKMLIDVVDVEEQYFINVFGLGIDAEVVHLAHKHPLFSKLPFKEMRYGFPLIQMLKDPASLRVKIKADGKIVFNGETFFLAIYNGKREGAYFNLNTRGKIDDGILNGIVIREVGLKQRLACLIKAMREDLSESNQVHCFSGRKIEIIAQDPRQSFIDVQIDGEPIFFTQSDLGGTKLKITNHHKALRVLAPKINKILKS